MEHLQIKQDEIPRQIYVIIRVFNLISPAINMRIFVDPWRLQDTLLNFDVTPTTDA
jgi:hypothetical protein